MTIRSILLGFAMLAGAAASAGAADLGDYGGSLKDGPYGEPSMARWYLRADTGYAWYSDSDMTEPGAVLKNESIDGSWIYGGGIGMYFSNRLRGDITVDFRSDAHAEADVVSSPIGPGDRQFDLETLAVLANLYWDIPMHPGFTPYVGFGVGYANVKAHNGTAVGCGCVHEVKDGVEDNFAAALMVGFSKSLHEGFHLDAGYRFTWLGDGHTGDIVNSSGAAIAQDPILDDIYTHEIRVGLRYDIW